MVMMLSPVAISFRVLFLALGVAGVVTSSSHPPNWHQFVRSPTSSVVKPVGIVLGSTNGHVSNPDGMITGLDPTVFSHKDAEDNLPAVVVDFGKNVVGILSVHFGGSQNACAGLPGLRLAFAETMEYLDRRSDFTRSDNARGKEELTHGTDQVAVKDEAYTWRNLHGCQHGTQVCADGLHGFRYVKIWLEALESDAPYTSSFGSVSISALSLEWSAYLGTPETFTGVFKCSDEELTQWWYNGVYTVDLGTDVFLANETEPRDTSSPTLEGKPVLLDGAKRDRDPYVGDLAIASLTSYLSRNFSESTRNVLENLAEHQRDDGWIPPASINNYTVPLFDYPLWWVVCSVDLVMYTGNTSFAEAYWRVLVKTLDEYYPAHTNGATKLLEKKAEMNHGDYAFLPRSGPITYYNALYIHALSYASQLAESLGRHEDADRWHSRATSVADALMKHNFDKKVGAFFDGGPCPGEDAGTYCNIYAQDGNSIAIVAGVTDGPTSAQILDYWTKVAARPYGNAFYDSSILRHEDHYSDRVYAFISYFELAARFATPGKAESAFDEIRRLYGWMSTHDPGITMWEGIGPNGSAYEGGFTSMAHGWSTGIVPLMSNYVLGVKPLEPGFATWRVCPVVDGGGLTWARGGVQTPYGQIGVFWEKRDIGDGDDAFVLEVTAPNNTQGMICIPVDGFASRQVKVDGQGLSGMKHIIAEEDEDGASVTISVEGGSHTIIIGL